jgi:hypothetical protein
LITAEQVPKRRLELGEAEGVALVECPGITRRLAVTKSATSEPRMAVTANLGAGKNAGRFSTLASNFENIRLVTGLGAAALTGPEMSTVSRAQRIRPTASSMWIQGMY